MKIFSVLLVALSPLFFHACNDKEKEVESVAGIDLSGLKVDKALAKADQATLFEYKDSVDLHQKISLVVTEFHDEAREEIGKNGAVSLVSLKLKVKDHQAAISEVVLLDGNHHKVIHGLQYDYDYTKGVYKEGEIPAGTEYPVYLGSSIIDTNNLAGWSGLSTYPTTNGTQGAIDGVSNVIRESLNPKLHDVTKSIEFNICVGLATTTFAIKR